MLKKADFIIGDWLKRSQAHVVVEAQDEVTVPPTAEELRELIKYLKDKDLDPKIVGSTALVYHLQDTGHRPTHDVDIVVNTENLPEPPPGWTPENVPGLTSWKSPGGGIVEFMHPGYEFAGGGATVPEIKVHDPEAELPMATIMDLFKMKLKSDREKDTMDLVSLVRGLGRIPDESELGPLDDAQKQTLDFVKNYVAAKDVLKDKT